MILKTLREFELEEENRQLKRQLYELRGQALVPMCVEETPQPTPASWDETGRDLYRVAKCSRVWMTGPGGGYKTMLECRNPRTDQRGPDDPVPIYSAGYFISREAAITDEALAHVAANMHMHMVATLHAKFLRKPHEEDTSR